MVVCSGWAEPSPDFQSEILPIFQRHCLDCHGKEKRDGELNLETLAGVRLGGHSGSPLLAKELDQSELYLRVTSTTPGYRMPKKGDPLSADELGTLVAWIQTTPLIADQTSADPASNSDAILPTDSGQNESTMFSVVGCSFARTTLTGDCCVDCNRSAVALPSCTSHSNS